ncbi:HTH-type transcriptional regulator CysL [Rhizobium rhizogenes]|uniref:HTH-type transcriptional regulator TtuA n=1 Tax=Rhizobium rhizogenes TaxID=359 RepID=A0AAN2DCM3_RHIRH|nr:MULTISPECIES: LysR family transcriptional regulator [Rhizobium/Agrobacterium group]AQS61868.1 LysR family transcriptional regulator [Rhizobium rhizogenes]MCZ7442897.1 LysR family transcriptional regulator [Rhizobium rhizogenes]NSZ78887.1 LysR family transcriptional regulator [Agrobacterium tumefaciens]OAM65689.1 LysR family transcriptional regulator [Rhizobium rhizogenes]CAD0211100.1 HTH-type transcriptional regulator CysL [Rhizobium rhizogenes]
MRFDLTDLRLFLHVVEAESITQGADRAGMALPSASARIRGMEEMSGVSLLDRGARGVRVTPAGEALAHHARIVLGQMEQMRGDLQLYARGLRGQVRIFSGRAAMAHLPGALRQYLVDHPTIDIDLEERQSPDVVAAVAAGQADIGIAADTTDTGTLETRPFEIDRLVVITPASHALAARKMVTFAELLDEPFVGLPAESALQGHLAIHAAREGRPFKLRIRLDSFEDICAMVSSGVGLAIVPEVYARRYQADLSFKTVAISDVWARRHLLICARSFAGLPVHARAVVDYLTMAKGQG